MREIRTGKTILLIAILLSSANAQAQGKTPREPKAVEEIQTVLKRQVDAWNRGDLEGFMAGYWNSPNLSFYSGGSRTYGWQPTLDRYRRRYQSEGREMGHLDFSEVQVELLGKDVAFVRGNWRLKTKTSEPGGLFTGGLFTLILRKRPEGWRIIHDHTSSGPA